MMMPYDPSDYDEMAAILDPVEDLPVDSLHPVHAYWEMHFGDAFLNEDEVLRLKVALYMGALMAIGFLNVTNEDNDDLVGRRFVADLFDFGAACGGEKKRQGVN